MWEFPLSSWSLLLFPLTETPLLSPTVLTLSSKPALFTCTFCIEALSECLKLYSGIPFFKKGLL